MIHTSRGSQLGKLQVTNMDKRKWRIWNCNWIRQNCIAKLYNTSTSSFKLYAKYRLHTISGFKIFFQQTSYFDEEEHLKHADYVWIRGKWCNACITNIILNGLSGWPGIFPDKMTNGAGRIRLTLMFARSYQLRHLTTDNFSYCVGNKNVLHCVGNRQSFISSSF